jgi:hypothetical protein
MAPQRFRSIACDKVFAFNFDADAVSVFAIPRCRYRNSNCYSSLSFWARFLLNQELSRIINFVVADGTRNSEKIDGATCLNTWA